MTQTGAWPTQWFGLMASVSRLEVLSHALFDLFHESLNDEPSGENWTVFLLA
jgi:hypothetical protein